MRVKGLHSCKKNVYFVGRSVSGAAAVTLPGWVPLETAVHCGDSSGAGKAAASTKEWKEKQNPR